MSDDDSTTVAVDLHVHSALSYDARDSVRLLLEHASEIGLDSVVITDHDRIQDSVHAAEIAEEYDLIGVPGVEISTANGHVLGIGIEELPEIGAPVKQTVEEIREMGGAAIIAHPFQRIRHGVKKQYIPDCDGIEVYNSWLFTGYRNRKARKFADNHNYTPVAGSDAHSVRTVGRAHTELVFDDKPRDAITSDDIVTAIKNGETDIEGRRIPIHRSAGHYLMGAGKILSMYLKRYTVPW